jgi:hypothetical protein
MPKAASRQPTHSIHDEFKMPRACHVTPPQKLPQKYCQSAPRLIPYHFRRVCM